MPTLEDFKMIYFRNYAINPTLILCEHLTIKNFQ